MSWINYAEGSWPNLKYSHCSFRKIPAISYQIDLHNYRQGVEGFDADSTQITAWNAIYLYSVMLLRHSVSQSLSLSLSLSLKLKVSYDRRSVGQYIVVSSPHLELMARFFFCIDNCGFLDLGHPLWREDGSVIYSYNCFWALPEQSLSGPSSTELRPYSSVSFEILPTWRTRSLYLYPPGTGWPSYNPRHWVPFAYPLTSQGYGARILTPLHSGTVSLSLSLSVSLSHPSCC
jgi:hypothetical protein